MGLYEEIRDVVIEQLGVKPEEVTPESSFIDDLGSDSLDTEDTEKICLISQEI